MDKLGLESLIYNSLKAYPQLKNQWDNFILNYKPLSQEIEPKKCFLIKMLLKGRAGLEYQFKQGINDLSNLDPENKLELDYLFKLALTGKNRIEHLTLKKLYSFYLEFRINDDVYTIYLDFNQGIKSTLYKDILDQVLDKKSEKTILFHTNKISEYESLIKRFFLEKLNLPSLGESSFEENRFKTYPLSFATYFNYMFLERKRPFKIFEEEQSNNWRKKAFQIMIGLEGIPYFSFFQWAIAKKEYYLNRFEKVKKQLFNHLIQQEKKEDWEVRFIRLMEQKRKLINLKRNFYEEMEEHYQYDIEAELDKEISDLESKLRHHKTREIQIIQEIQHLGGDFKPFKKKKSHDLDSSEKNQFHLFISDPKKKKENNERIDELIGDYFINQSQLEMIEIELKDIEKKKKDARKETVESENQSNQNLNNEIEIIDKEIEKLIMKEWNKLFRFIKVENNEEMYSFINIDMGVLNKLIMELKDLYRLNHQKKLVHFYDLLKTLINEYSDLEIKQIQFKKNYLPKITIENEKDISFSDLARKEKEIFITLFYLCVFYINIKSTDFLHFLFLKKDFFPELVVKLDNQFNNQIIFT